MQCSRLSSHPCVIACEVTTPRRPVHGGDVKPDIVIVGGVIGGLFAANALIAHGLRVSVYEHAPALGEIGAGVYLTPNSVRHLERVGLGPATAKYGALVGPASQYFRH